MGVLRDVLQAMGVPMKPTLGFGPNGQPVIGPRLGMEGILPQPQIRQPHGMGVDWPYVSKEKLGGADIFVGGYLDNHEPFGAMQDYANRYSKQTGRPVQYLPNAKHDQLMNAIRAANRSDGPVNLVGHSLGGTDVYNAAAAARREGLRVDNLITLDQVGGMGVGPIRIAPRRGTAAPGHWLNVEGAPSSMELNDRIAQAGGKPSQLPVGESDENLRIPAHHEDVDAMMAAGGRKVLDDSRRIDPQPSSEDDLPIDDWMRQRNGSLVGGRR